VTVEAVSTCCKAALAPSSSHRRGGSGDEAITPSRPEGLAGAATALHCKLFTSHTKPFHLRRISYDVPAWASGRPSRVVFSSSAGLIIPVTDGEGEVIEREAGCTTGPALSRMMVMDHSVRLRRPQDSMVLI
jgi:hypothetical protein